MTKPSAFMIMPYQEPFEDIYKRILEPVIMINGFKLIRADKIATSTPFAHDIEDSIAFSDLIIADVSIYNPNVYYELGMAQAHKKEIIRLTNDVETIPSDTKHFRHLIYNVNNEDKLKIDFEEWVQNTRAYQLKSRKESSKILNRGDILPNITDASFHLGHSLSTDDRSDIINCIRDGSLIPPKYLYKFDKGCHLWLELCQDLEYRYFVNSVNYLVENVPKIFEAIGSDIIDNAPDYISLGPGNGKKDQIVLSNLMGMQKIGNDKMYYYPFDISKTMISYAIHTIKSMRSSVADIADNLKIKALVADFEKTLKAFSLVYQYRAETNIFSLLGNTLGNIDNETSFLTKIRQAMFMGDVLLIEVRLKSNNLNDIGGSLALDKKFAFSPLDMLGVEYDEKKLHYSILHSRSTIKNTRTIAASYNNFIIPRTNNMIKSAYLSYVHEYDHEALESVFEDDLKFEILRSFINIKNGIAFYVLRKSSE